MKSNILQEQEEQVSRTKRGGFKAKFFVFNIVIFGFLIFLCSLEVYCNQSVNKIDFLAFLCLFFSNVSAFIAVYEFIEKRFTKKRFKNCKYYYKFKNQRSNKFN